jgi:hypothetical protein
VSLLSEGEPTHTEKKDVTDLAQFCKIYSFKNQIVLNYFAIFKMGL